MSETQAKVHSQLYYMRRLAVDAFDVFIEGLVETKMRVKEAVAKISQANCKGKKARHLV